ncbi:hemin-degrading factor [Ideonella azotifigens]|nr:ChuX/HutX family heme-like substrate-binding protein [Ideonella azotifigens]MCD2341643.1 hemin-degrading factor [Ideonella azotifigens]
MTLSVLPRSEPTGRGRPSVPPTPSIRAAAWPGFATDPPARRSRTAAADARRQAVPLQPCWPALMAGIGALGEVQARTGQAACTLAASSPYGRALLCGDQGHVSGGRLELRLFYAAWARGFAVQEHTANGLQRSLQFFDAQGLPLHEVTLGPRSRVPAFDALVARFAAPAAAQFPQHAANSHAPAACPATRVDPRAFRAGWASMRVPQDFYALLRRHGLTRLAALQLASPEFAQPVDGGAAHEVLARAAQTGLPLSLCCGNPGAVQTCSGPLHHVEVQGPWLQVNDAGLQLQLREDCIASAWRVRLPASEGLVSSLELFDADGRTLAIIGGQRAPGQAERCEWRELLASVALEDSPC